MTEENIGALIEGAYDAAIDGCWYEWLEQLRLQMGACGGFLAHMWGTTTLPIACGDDIHRNHLERYLSVRNNDPWYQTASNQHNRLVSVDEQLSQQRIQSNIEGLWLNLQSHFHIGSVLSNTSGESILTLHRRPQLGDFSPEQLESLSLLIEHLRSALALTQLLFEQVEQRLQQQGLLNAAIPQAVVRANGIPAYMNHAMKSYLSQATNIVLRQGRMETAEPMVNRLIQQAQLRACDERRRESRLPLDGLQLMLSPLDETVLANAALWQIQPHN
ncbi:hypothetical protein [Ferrimonas lipolytica]|uniref:Uncharacterized protein n=1 Tax=Ferrimonas lipolytica TaxID=2724191 RepID=A0A6H1UE95_9GAMM|nr:hypothetical protein [Ferrimonas lipolytica]QIZ77148.1 hypothetical protein HER31_09825 [Ferrimonas lipolytica]